MLTSDSLYGQLQLPDWPSDLIVRALRDHGEWAATETELASLAMPKGARLWDLGAFLGTFSMGVARLQNLSSVLAVEANPELEQALRTNLDSNLTVPVRAVVCGVGRQSGWIDPIARGSLNDNHGAQAFAFSQNQAPGSIRCRSLVDLRAEHGGYDFLKLDLEGMERDVLIGDRDYLRDNHPVIWAECNEELGSLDLYEALRWLGYRVVYAAFPAFRRNNFRGADDLIHPHAYEAAMLAAPEPVLQAFEHDAAKPDIIIRRLDNKVELRRALYDTPRWGRPEWQGLGRAELLARIGRIVNGTELKDFLKPGETG